MRMAQLSVVAAAALATFVAGSAAIGTVHFPSAGRTPLLPLSERDLNATRETGCECSFRVGRSTLVQMIGDELTIRTAAGRRACGISAEQFSALSNGRGTATCAGLRLSLRPTGPVTAHAESDSADGPAALSVGQGRNRRTQAGRWGCAC